VAIVIIAVCWKRHKQGPDAIKKNTRMTVTVVLPEVRYSSSLYKRIIHYVKRRQCIANCISNVMFSFPLITKKQFASALRILSSNHNARQFILIRCKHSQRASQLAHNVITTLVKGCCKVRSNLTFTRRSYNITFLSGIRARVVNVG
jgi:hypothetical protein